MHVATLWNLQHVHKPSPDPGPRTNILCVSDCIELEAYARHQDKTQTLSKLRGDG